MKTINQLHNCLIIRELFERMNEIYINAMTLFLKVLKHAVSFIIAFFLLYLENHFDIPIFVGKY